MRLCVCVCVVGAYARLCTGDDGATAAARLENWRWAAEMERMAQLCGRKAREDFALLAKEMLARRPKSVELLKRVLIEAHDNGSAEEAVAAADALLAVARAQDLSVLLMRPDEEEDGAARKEAEAAKDAIIEALWRKADAQVRRARARARARVCVCV